MLTDLKEAPFRISTPGGRGYSCKDLGSELRIVIRSPRNAFVIAFFGLLLGSWGIGAAAAQLAISRSPNLFEDGFLVLWIVAWCAIGLAMLYVWLWQVAGREIVTASPSQFTIRKEVLGVGRTRRYDPAKINQLRVSGAPFHTLDWGGVPRFLGFSGGDACFTYENATVRFGASIEEEGAFRLVESLKRGFRH